MSGAAKKMTSRRREMDFMRLCGSGRAVYASHTVGEFWVEFHGPEGTPYEDGFWVLHVTLPEEYPLKSPSIGFGNRILHPNVDEQSGSICLDVINQTWTPIYQLENIFEVFLPQLLRYPNPSDPLNPSAARMLESDPNGYDAFLRDHVRRHATRDLALAAVPAEFLPSEEEDHSKAAGSECEGSSTGHPKGMTDSSVTPTEDQPCQEAAEEEYIPDEIDI